jgi:hypothetical protein
MEEIAVGGAAAPQNQWAARIGAAWQKSIDAIFETGRLIAQAKAALPHGAFGQMIESELPFSGATARKLMIIAEDQRLTDRAHVNVLPPSWGTLYELTKLDDDTFKRRIAEGSIRPDMQRREVTTGGARAIMAGREQPRDSLDFFPTPPWATRALVEVVLPHLGASLDGRIVRDPACGEGHITGVLAEYEIEQVLGSDIKDYGRDSRSAPGWTDAADFLDAAQLAAVPDWMITNPPFGEKTLDFALRALETADVGVALFVRQQWLEGVDRYERLFRDRPPTVYAQFSERVNLCAGRWDPFGSTATAYCWLVWVKDMAPQPTFWIPPGQRKALHRADDIERFTARPVLPPKIPRPTKAGAQEPAVFLSGSENPEAGEGCSASPASVTEDELTEYKVLWAISSGITVAGDGIADLRQRRLVFPDDLVLTPAGAQRAQYLHERVKAAATSPDSPDAVRVRADRSQLELYGLAVDAISDRKGRLTMEQAATVLRLGREAAVTPSRIAEDLGHPLGTIKTWLNRLGLTDINRMHQTNARAAEQWSRT